MAGTPAYCRQEGPLSKSQSPETKATDWWKAQAGTGILRRVSLRLANLKSSSANTERVFSLMRLIQAPTRTNFSHTTFTNLAKSKVALMQSESDAVLSEIIGDFKKVSLEEDEDSDERPKERVIMMRRTRRSKKALQTRTSRSTRGFARVRFNKVESFWYGGLLVSPSRSWSTDSTGERPGRRAQLSDPPSPQSRYRPSFLAQFLL